MTDKEIQQMALALEECSTLRNGLVDHRTFRQLCVSVMRQKAKKLEDERLERARSKGWRNLEKQHDGDWTGQFKDIPGRCPIPS